MLPVDRGDTFIAEALSDAVSIIAFVQDRVLQDIVGIQAFVKTLELSAIVSLPRRQMQGDTAIFVNRRRVNFGRQPATRASQSLAAAGFFWRSIRSLKHFFFRRYSLNS